MPLFSRKFVNKTAIKVDPPPKIDPKIDPYCPAWQQIWPFWKKNPDTTTPQNINL
jgi:hypothetical protein